MCLFIETLLKINHFFSTNSNNRDGGWLNIVYLDIHYNKEQAKYQFINEGLYIKVYDNYYRFLITIWSFNNSASER